MDIDGYDGDYWIDTVGNVFSVRRNRYLKPVKGPDAYLRVGLNKNGNRKTYLVHRLIALTYIPNPDKLPQVNHKNKIRNDNRIENLEWCTNMYNTQSINTSHNIGNIKKTGKKYHFTISINKKRIGYYCPNEHVAFGMRSIYTDLL